MKTDYDIRDPSLQGIFISFNTEWEARRYWDEHCRYVPHTNRMFGAVLVEHKWETEAEKETARLNFLLSEGGIAAFTKECLAVDYTSDEWHKVARAALDIARKSPADTATVIWPKPASKLSAARSPGAI